MGRKHQFLTPILLSIAGMFLHSCNDTGVSNISFDEARRVFRYGIFPTDEYELVYIIDVDDMTEKVYRKKCSIADYNPSE